MWPLSNTQASTHCAAARGGRFSNSAFVCCSDGDATENDTENQAMLVKASMLAQDVASTSSARVVCETEVSTRCPYGWAYYKDDGSEGVDSCVWVSSTSAVWSVANSSCPAGSHLLTVSGSQPASGLLAFSTSVWVPSSTNFTHIGLVQSASSSQVCAGLYVPSCTRSLTLVKAKKMLCIEVAMCTHAWQLSCPGWLMLPALHALAFRSRCCV